MGAEKTSRIEGGGDCQAVEVGRRGSADRATQVVKTGVTEQVNAVEQMQVMVQGAAAGVARSDNPGR